MKVLAMGATGAIGGKLVDCLDQNGHEVHVTTRKARASTETVRYIHGNARDDIFLSKLLNKNWDVIVDFMIYDISSFRRRINALLDATGQYVFISSARVFANSSEPITERSPRLLEVSEDSDFLLTEDYALTKARQEDVLRMSGRDNWTIIRPYITFGEGRLQLGSLEKECWFYRALKGRSIVFCEDLMSKYTTLTDGSEVARMIAALIGNPAALGEDFNLTGSEAITWEAVMTLYLEELQGYLGTRPSVVFQDLESFCGHATSVPQVKYDRMYDRHFNPAKISQFIDMDSMTDFRSALRANVRAQLAQKNDIRVEWRAEGIKDRAANEHASLREICGMKPKFRYLVYRYLPLEAIKKLRAL